MDLIGLSIGAIEQYSYFFLFILMFLEGPIVTLVASFAASFGVFNIYIIIIISILGNVIPDIVYFHIGKFSRKKNVERFIYKLGLTTARIAWLEKNLKEHTKKAIMFIKLTPFIPVPGILLAGFLKVPFRRFFSISIFVDIIAVLIYAGIGFYSGWAGISLVKYFRLEKYLLFAIVILMVFIYWLSKKVYSFAIKHIRGQD